MWGLLTFITSFWVKSLMLPKQSVLDSELVNCISPYCAEEFFKVVKNLCQENAHRFSSVQSLSRVQLLCPHGLQHARPPCPSPTPGVHSNSCPSSQCCHPTISSSDVTFSSCFQSFPASESFPMSQLFASATKVLEFQLQHQSFQWTLRTDLL